MLRRCLTLAVVALGWVGYAQSAEAQHELRYEFDGTHVGVSIERFMGIDFVDYEEPIGSDVTARFLLNASEPAPTSIARTGIDVFIKRFSIGVAGGVTTEDVGVIAPRVGYLFGLTPNIGLWLRAGGFYAALPNVSYAGLTAEALFQWFPYSILAFHLGPTLDVAFASEGDADYIAIGMPELGLTVFF